MSDEPEAKRPKTMKTTKIAAAEEQVKEIKDYCRATQNALEKLDKVQNDLDNLNEIASEEILKVEQKYNQMRQPHFEQRNELIKKIPNFWVTVFINHPQVGTILEEEEEECLHYLTKLEIKEFDDIKAGYKLKFTFDENPYFENREIAKEYYWNGTDPHCSSTTLQWKPEKQKLLNGTCKTATEQKSFFKWLCESSDPMADDIAEAIKDDIWPNPLQYYLAPDVEVDEGDEEDGEAFLEHENSGGGEDASVENNDAKDSLGS